MLEVLKKNFIFFKNDWFRIQKITSVISHASPKRFFNRFDTWMLQIPHYHVEALGRKLAQRLDTVITEILSVEKRKLHVVMYRKPENRN